PLCIRVTRCTMVKRDNKRRWRRVLILALLLLIPSLLSDLPLFSKMGHGHGSGAVAGGQPGASAQGGTPALLPVGPGALGSERHHRHAASGNVNDGQGEDGLLHNLVYTHDIETGDDNAPLNDGVGDPGFSFGGDGGGHPGGGGGPTGFGGPGFDPG